MLHRLGTVEFGRGTADRAIYYLGAFPTAYFLAAPYNHAVFVLLSVGCLYAIRRQAWWLAGALGGPARAELLAIGLIPVGLAAYATYCWYALGDPLAFSRAQWYLLAYAVPVLLVPLFLPLMGANPVSSMARYILDLTVVFLFLARIGAGQTFERPPVAAVS